VARDLRGLDEMGRVEAQGPSILTTRHLLGAAGGTRFLVLRKELANRN
jgi:hypothetical protein